MKEEFGKIGMQEVKFPRGISIIYFHILDQLHCFLCIIYVSIALHIFFRYIGKGLWTNNFCHTHLTDFNRF